MTRTTYISCFCNCNFVHCKFFFIKLGNVSSLDPTRERAKRSLAVSKDVRMGPTLDA